MKKLLITLLIILISIPQTFATNTDYLMIIENEIYSQSWYINQISKIDELTTKLNNINSAKYWSFKRELAKTKSIIIEQNFSEIIKNFQEQNPNFNYLSNFLNFKNSNIEASYSPFYLNTLKKNIIAWNLNSEYIWSFVYLLDYQKNQLQKNSNYVNDYKKINNKNLETLKIDTPLNDNDKKIIAKLGYNLYNKDNLDNLKTYIINNNIWSDSILFIVYLKYKNFINTQTSFKIKTNSKHTLQKYNLSCEANSAKFFANHFKNNSITEDNIINNLPTYTWKIGKANNQVVWWNPNKEFVGNIKWKQSSSFNKFTWYWVYAEPISKSLTKIWVENNVAKFDESIIKENLANNKPVMFWYLMNTASGNMYTKPIVWKNFWEEIKWYIGQHTWVITWVDLNEKWNISTVYFYEWRNLSEQKLAFSDLKYRASFFDMIIY